MRRASALVLAVALAGALAGVSPERARAAGHGGAAGARTTVLAGGSFGDGLEAVRASLNYPRGVAIAHDGTVFLSDFGHHQVRAVRPDGVIVRVAGTVEGFSGDGGPARSAKLNRPMGLAFDGTGGLLIADAGNSRIRRVDLRSGVITTVAGNGERTFAGDGKPATKASLAFPHDIAVGFDGSVYIADHENYRVRRVAPDGTMSTFAGDGTGLSDFDGTPASLSSVVPTGIETDGAGNVYVGDLITCSVRFIDRQTRTMRTVAGGNGCGNSGDGGAATDAAMSSPMLFELDEQGRLWIPDTNNHRVRMVDTRGIITTVAGSGSPGCTAEPMGATEADIMYPFAVGVDSDGRLVVAAQGFFVGDCGGRVYSVEADTLAPFAGNGTAFAGGSGDPATAINFWNVRSVAWGPDEQPYFGEARGVWTVTPDGRALLVAGGAYGDVDGPADEAQFRSITGLAFTSDGALLIADSAAGKIKRLAGGTVETIAGNPESSDRGDGVALHVRITPMDIAPTPDGGVYFTDGFGRVRLLRDGMVTTLGGVDENRYLDPIGDGGPVSGALFREPWGITATSDGSVYVADRQHHRIRRIGPSGIVTTVAGDGGEVSRGDGTLAVLASFSTPEDVAVDSAGNLFITDGKNAETYQPGGHVIRHVSPSGMVSRLAGTGASEEGRDGPSLQSALRNPTAVALAPGGVVVGDGTGVRLITHGAAGWPDPARLVTCDRFFTDGEGDAKAQYGVSFVYGPNMPWADLLWADVQTDSQTLTVTMQFLDINERVLAPPGPELGTAWAWTYFLKANGGYKYLAAYAPYPLGSTAPAFEYGDSGLGRGSPTKAVTRRGAATGTVDLETDRVTISAPLSALGLKPGHVVIYHEATGGELVEAGFARFVNPDDTTEVRGFLPGTARSFVVGRRCPEDY